MFCFQWTRALPRPADTHSGALSLLVWSQSYLGLMGLEEGADLSLLLLLINYTTWLRNPNPCPQSRARWLACQQKASEKC